MFVPAPIFAVWIRVDFTAFRHDWVSFATLEAHAIRALVLEDIGQAAIRLIRWRVVTFIKPPRRGAVDAAQIDGSVWSSSAGGSSEKSSGESELHE